MTGRQPPPDIVMAAQAAFRLYPKGAPVCVLLAQWADESGWGEHTPPGSNNPFGEKALPRQPRVQAATMEVIGGHLTSATAPFRAFPSIAEAFAVHAEHLATSHYFVAARACLPDIRAFCRALGGGTPARPTYSTSPRYGADLWAVIVGSDLTRYDIHPGAGPMTDTSPPAPAAPIMAATMDMARSVLMGVGTPLAAHGYVTGSQWQQIVGGGIALASAVWSYVAAHPGKTNPLRAVQSLVRAGGGQSAWNGDVVALEAAVLPIVERAVAEQVKAHAGILAGPVDAVADKAIQTAAAAGADHLKIT